MTTDRAELAKFVLLAAEGLEQGKSPMLSAGACREIATSLAQADAQLPEGMKHCTILFKECEKGHGRLTATNWIDNGCHWCALTRAQAEIGVLREALTTAQMELRRVKGDHDALLADFGRLQARYATLVSVATDYMDAVSKYTSLDEERKRLPDIQSRFATALRTSETGDAVMRVVGIENWCHRCAATSPNNKRCGVCDGPICQRVNPAALNSSKDAQDLGKETSARSPNDKGPVTSEPHPPTFSRPGAP